MFIFIYLSIKGKEVNKISGLISNEEEKHFKAKHLWKYWKLLSRAFSFSQEPWPSSRVKLNFRKHSLNL